MSITFTPLVQSLPSNTPFTGPETLERQRGQPFRARLGANESAFGISPLAKEALQEQLGLSGCSWYGDPESHELRQLLAKKHNIDSDNICVDAGIDALLGLLVRMMLEPGDNVVTSLGAYPTFNYHVNGFGGVLQMVPYRNHHEDPEALLAAAIKHNARLIYLSNPDNPMGTCLPQSSVQTLIDRLPCHCTLILDEAYVEFMTDQSPPVLDINNERVIRLRTFSKAYGLAGMRIGYAIANTQLISGFNRIRNHFAVNRLAQIAAEASLKDEHMLPLALQHIKTGRQNIYNLANSLNLPYLQSSTNFVAVDLGSAQLASECLSWLGKQGVFMRKPMASPQNSFIRIGIGTDNEHQYFANKLTDFLNEHHHPMTNSR